MKFKLSVNSKEKAEELEKFCRSHQIELDEMGEYTIIESEKKIAFLSAHDSRHESVRISPEEVIFIEAFGRDIVIHTSKDTYFAQDRIYQLEELLNPKEFLRVSKSVIISRKHVRKIRPSLSVKFVLTMSDGTLVDVTRSYYSDFRQFFQF